MRSQLAARTRTLLGRSVSLPLTRSVLPPGPVLRGFSSVAPVPADPVEGAPFNVLSLRAETVVQPEIDPAGHVSRPSVSELFRELTQRSLIAGITHEGVRDLPYHSAVDAEPLCAYSGFDPTASSLHIGNLISIIVLSHFASFGHHAVGLIGGATGEVGDPSFRTTSRTHQAQSQVSSNASSLEQQLATLLLRGSSLALSHRLERQTLFGGDAEGLAAQQARAYPFAPTYLDHMLAEVEVPEALFNASPGAEAEQETVAAVAAERRTVAGMLQGAGPVPVAGPTAAAPGLATRAARAGAAGGQVELLNNRRFYEGLGLLDFLRDVGSRVRVQQMIGRDSIRSRLAPAGTTGGDSGDGLSLAEFTYQILQAYDFYRLFRDRSCRVQIGGSDQWGNIVAGVDLIGSMPDTAATLKPAGWWRADGPAPPGPGDHANPSDVGLAIGMTTPLVTDSQGRKFGKSLGNAIWLDAAQTSPFHLFQFFRHAVPDADVGRMLQYYTFLGPASIQAVLNAHADTLGERGVAQNVLAFEVTRLVHGELAAIRSYNASRLLFSSEIQQGRTSATARELGPVPRPLESAPRRALAAALTATGLPGWTLDAWVNPAVGAITALATDAKLAALSSVVPCHRVPIGDILRRGTDQAPVTVAGLCVDVGLCASRGEAIRLATQGALYVNNRQIGPAEVRRPLDQGLLATGDKPEDGDLATSAWATAVSAGVEPLAGPLPALPETLLGSLTLHERWLVIRAGKRPPAVVEITAGESTAVA
ncbi:hypothetical protein H696_03521 [Fonticula alba]|uniref:tyrosine--tRNA ligase n=1 Tax=Fonticula alba TaxID=691883 RepID=A0A058Z830_FONAL|nr:hypothetical protein H696_03521 [Fonticula alba]KCV70058.1 hypothetical protein H696_03521 [Fonticula alba]|eukprot:XP_009495664.1 hypothetical protein H696_03521 [Fonticula alba]